MPRLQAPLLRHCRAIHPLLSLLLREVRDLSSARNELRWLREHVAAQKPIGTLARERLLRRLCLERSRGKPLQYILGSQPFGDLEILCRPGVLIPRPETENHTSLLAKILIDVSSARKNSPQSKRRELRILDLCTGTGCIPLLLHSVLSPYYPSLTLVGVDVSSKALRLAKKNLDWNIARGHLPPSARTQISYRHGDVLDPQQRIEEDYDIVISNPPYISPTHFAKETQRSVRNYEPKLALVPPPQTPHSKSITLEPVHAGDVFYPRILQIARACGARMVLMELDGAAQAERVATMAGSALVWNELQVWRDELDEARWSSCGSEGRGEGLLGPARVMGFGRERALFAARRSFYTCQ